MSTCLLFCLAAGMAVSYGAEGPGVEGGGSTRHLEATTLENVLYVEAGSASGSAFRLRHAGKHYLVTARHVVESCLDAGEGGIEFRVGGKRGRALRSVTLLREDRRADIAVFTYEENELMPYFPRESPLVPCPEVKLASQVFLVGYPRSPRNTLGPTDLRVVGGYVAGLKKYVPGSTLEYIDIDMQGIEHGHSGGPIVLLQSQVVAVAVRRATGSISTSIAAAYAVPIKYVTGLIDGTPVREDRTPLNELLLNTVLVCGFCGTEKTEHDIWAQRIGLETGEGIWGESGVFAASSLADERGLVAVPSEGESTLLIYEAVLAAGDSDIRMQKLSRYGELMFHEGLRSAIVCDTQFQERKAVAVSDGESGAIVFFERHFTAEDGRKDIDILAQRMSANGERMWDPKGVGVATALIQEKNPQALADGSGGAIVVFEAEDETRADIFAQRVSPDGRALWHEGKRSAVVASTAHREYGPRIVPDGQGGGLVFYLADLNGKRILMGQRLSRFGDILWNEGRRGTPIIPRSLNPDPPSFVVHPDGNGGAFVVAVASDPASPQDTDILAQRVAADGALLWGEETDGPPRHPVWVASSRFAERNSTMIPDGRGGIVVAFEMVFDDGDVDVMAQRLDAKGTLLWNEGKRSSSLASSLALERSPSIVAIHGTAVFCIFEMAPRQGLGETLFGARGIGCNALALGTGAGIRGEGKAGPMLVLESTAIVDYRLRLEEEGEEARRPQTRETGGAER